MTPWLTGHITFKAPVLTARAPVHPTCRRAQWPSLTCGQGPGCGHVHDGVVTHRPFLRGQHKVVQPPKFLQLLLDLRACRTVLLAGVSVTESIPDTPQQHCSLKSLHCGGGSGAPTAAEHAQPLLLRSSGSLQSTSLTSALVIVSLSGVSSNGQALLFCLCRWH